MVKINKKKITVYTGEDVGKLISQFIDGGSQINTVPMEISMAILQEAWNRSSSRSSLTTLGHLSK